MPLTIRRWTETEFAASRDAWNALLDRSDADPLFSSWEWQYTWWETFAGELDLKLTLLAAYQAGDGALVGLAPLFIARARIKNLLSVTRLQFIGNCWNGPATMPTEYSDFIADGSVRDEVIEAFIEELQNMSGWDELVVSHLSTRGPTYRKLADKDGPRQVRQPGTFKSYYIDTRGPFDTYLAALGKKTRAKLHGQRRKLSEQGTVALTSSDRDDIDHYFSLLNALHERRWGGTVFQNRRLAFNARVASLLAETGGLHFSLLTVGGKPVSVLYDYRTGQREYNIQGGFDPEFSPKLSLAFLHLGYVIEQAFADPDIDAFYLLPGPGKTTHYKDKLTEHFAELCDLQWIKSRSLGFAYRAYDAIRQPSTVH